MGREKQVEDRDILNRSMSSKAQVKAYMLLALLVLLCAGVLVFLSGSPGLTGFAAAGVNQVTIYEEQTAAVYLGKYFANTEQREFKVMYAVDLTVEIEGSMMYITPKENFEGKQTIELVSGADKQSFVVKVIRKDVPEPEIPAEPVEPSENVTENETLPVNETETPVNETETPPVNETETPPVNETLPVNETETPINEPVEIPDYETIMLGNKKLGEKIDDELLFDVVFVNKEIDDETLTLIFYHTSNDSQPVYVEGDVEFELSSDTAAPFENVSLVVTLDDGIVPEFELHVGDTSEVFRFGKKIPKVDIEGKKVKKCKNKNKDDRECFNIIDRDDDFVDVLISKENASVYIRRVDASDIRALFNWISNTVLTTEIFAAEPIDMESATITLPRIDDVTAIVECTDFDFDFKDCMGDWIVTDTPFNVTEKDITFTVTHFSGYGGGNIAVIDVQSYPFVGNEWPVRFNTTGTANLTITAINGTSWTDYADSGYSLKFLEIKCGNQSLNYTWINDSVFIENYYCNETGSEISKVITEGEHSLEFRYGIDVDYAHNQAGGGRPITEGVKFDFRTNDSANPVDFFGYDVGFGDINGDGYDDVLISAPRNDDKADWSGKIYLFYGPLTTKYLNTNDANASFYGSGVNSSLGTHFSIGDFNNDGKDDILTGTTYIPDVYTTDGRAYLIYGRYLTGDNNISVVANVTWTPEYTGCNDGLGSDAADAGDVNNDGYQDMLISADNFGYCDFVVPTQGGKVYLLYGQSAPLTGGDIGTRANASFYGSAFRSFLDAGGHQNRKGGDFNGDGYDDMIFHARNCIATDCSTDQNTAYIVFGKAWSGNNNISVARNASWYYSRGQHGFGDINGDGNDDLFLGDSGPYASTTLIYGSNAWNSDYNLSNSSTYNASWYGLVFERGEGGVLSGYDYNNDSQIDFVMGSPTWNLYSFEPQRGLLEIWSGRNFSQGDTWSNFTDWYGQGAGYTVYDALAYSIDFGGDTDNDGIIEVLAGAIGANDSRGAAYLTYNTRPVLSSVNLTSQYGTNYSNESLYCRGNVSDAEDVYLYAEYSWYRNGVLNRAGNVSPVANGTNTLVSTLPANQTFAYEVWNCELRFFDGWLYSDYVNSSSMTMNYFPPTQTKPVLNSTDGTNRVSQNLTVYPNVFYSLPVANITNWYKNGSSYAVLNLPFDINSSTTAKDYTSYGNNGTVSGAAWTSSGISGGAYVFDGVNDYINISDASSLEGMSRLTVELWMKANTLTAWTKPISKMHWLDYVNGSYFIDIDGGSNGVRFGAYNETGGGFVTTSTTAISTGTWYHIVGVMDGTNVLLYVNGVLNSSTTFSGSTIYDSAWPVMVGAELNWGSASEFFNGTVDEVRIYNNALTAQQVAANYNSGAAKFDKIVSQELALGNVWYTEVTPNDGVSEANVLMSNGLQVGTAPTQNTPSLIGGYDNNLTVYPQGVNDVDGHTVVNIPNWFRNGTSITFLNMPFDGLIPRHSVVSNEVLAMYFENNMKDFSGNGYDGTCTNCPTYTSSGKVDGAYSYDGSNDAITIPYTSNLAFVGQDFTIASWIYMDAEQDDWLASIFSKSVGSSTATDGYAFSIRGNSDGTNKGKLWANIMNASGFSEGPGNTVLAVGKWYHAVMTYDSSSRGVSFYLNGIADGGFTSDRDITDSGATSVTQVGRGIDTNAYVFDGSIDELHVFSRILSASEIRYLYKKAIDGRNDSVDYSPYGNDGTVTGAAWTSSGISGGAYSFDGSGDYIQSSLDKATIGTNFTISFWIYPTGFISTTGIFEIANTYNDGSPWIYFQRANSTTTSWYLNAGYQITQSISDNTWYYLALTYDGTIWRAYTNGIEDGNYTGDIGSYTGSYTWFGTGYNGYFSGKIDEARIYNRTLSPEQIAADYNAGTPIYRKIVLQEQAVGDVWRADLTPNDGYMDGLTKSSNNVTINQTYPNCTGASGDGVLIIDSTRTITADLICKVIIINNSATLFVNSTAAGNRSVLIQAEDLTVDAGSYINANGLGYLGGTSASVNGSGPGGGESTAGNGAGGGGSGGSGGSGSVARGGYWYNSSFLPLDMGSGGGFSNAYVGGNGGGAVKIVATNLFILNGSVDVNGKTPGTYYAGGGAGGSIYINAYNLTGSGTLLAEGGVSGIYYGGGGGGGRIIAYYNVTDWTASDFNRMSVSGGALDPTAPQPGAKPGEVGTLAFINNNDNTMFIAKGFRWQQDDYSTSRSTWVNLTVLNGIVTTNVTDLTFNVTQTFDITDSTWNNSNVSVPSTGSNVFTLYSNIVQFTNSTLTGQNYTVLNATNITIDVNSKINASGGGYLGGDSVTINGSGPGGGVGTAGNGAGGGGYGGSGGSGSVARSGYWYNSAFEPLDMGSGGGYSNTYVGGAGGGAVKIIATNLFILDGSVDVNGKTPGTYYAGGGAGGSIYINAYNLTGSGTLLAEGGVGGTNYGGGGGGGRIIAYYNVTDWTASDFNRMSVSGGTPGDQPSALPGEVGTLAFINNNDNTMFIAKGFRWQQDDYSTSRSTWVNLTVLNGIVTTNVTDLTINVTQTFDITDSTWNNSNVSVPSTGSNVFTLYSNIVQFTNSTLAGQNYTVLNATNITIDVNSKINASGGGYLGGDSVTLNGSGPGGGVGNTGVGYGGGGGGSGGSGGNGAYSTYIFRGGYWYNSSFLPSDMGSGGGYSNSYVGGNGGGAVKIVATNLFILDGSVDVNGNAPPPYPTWYGGGGAGGSIYISAYNLTGSGTLLAEGGASGTYYSGGGGGGRIIAYYNTTNLTASDFNRMSVSGGAATGAYSSVGEVGTLAFIDNDDNVMFIAKGFRWQQNDYDADSSWFSWVNLTVLNANVSTNVSNLELNVSQTCDVADSTWNNSNVSVPSTGSNVFTLRSNLITFANSTLVGQNYTTFDSPLMQFTNSSLIGQYYSTTTLNATSITLDSNSKINSSGGGYPGGDSVTINGSGPGGGVGTAGNGAGGGGSGGSGGSGSVARGGYWYNSSFEPLEMGSGGGYSNTYVGGNGGGAVKLVATNLFILDGSVDVNGKTPPAPFYYAGGGAGGSIYINAYNLTGSGTLLAEGGVSGIYYGGGGGGGRIIAYYNVTDWTASDFNRMSVSGGALDPTAPQPGAKPGEVGTLAFVNNVVDEVFSIKGFRFQSNDMISGAITHSIYNMTNSSVRFNESGVVVNGTSEFNLFNSNMTDDGGVFTSFIRSPAILFDSSSRINFTGRLDLTYNASFSDINTTYDSCSALTIENELVSEIEWINSSLTNLFNLSANVLLGWNYAHANSSTVSGLNTSANITFYNITIADPAPYWSVNDDNVFVYCPTSQCTELSYSGGVYKFNTTRFTNYTTQEEPLPPQPPVVSNVTLNSTYGTNYTTENLTVYFNVTDANNDSVTNITNWYVNDSSITLLNLPFDTNNNTFARDYSPYEKNGTVNGATWTSSGILGGAYSFDGSNDYIQSGLDKATIGTNFTISFWIYPATFVSATGIFEIADTNASGTPWIYFQRASSTATSWFLCGGYVLPQSSINDNTWTYIALTYDGTTWRAYKNGTADGTSGVCAGGYSGSFTWFGNGYDGYFSGTIDEARIYNRTLSPEQIAEDYNSGAPNYRVIVSQETIVGDVWQACVTPNDATLDGTTNCSNNLTIRSPGLSCGNIIADEIMTENITATGTCFNIAADNVTIDCAGYSLTGDYVGYGESYGFHIANRKNVTIENCLISNFSRAIYSNSSNDSLYRNDTMWYNQYGLYMNPSYNNSVLNNTVYNNSIDGLYLYDSHNNTIVNNTAFDNSVRGFNLNLSTYNNLTANSVYNNSVTGIYAFSCSNNTFAENLIINNTVRDVFLRNSSYNTLYNNTVYFENVGIFLSYASDYNNVTLNYVENLSQNGYSSYQTYDSEHNTLDNNTAFGSANYCFAVTDYSNLNTLRNNNATDCASIGFYLETAENNTLINNFAVAGYDGFSLNNGFNNTLINNTALDNTDYSIDLFRSIDNVFDNTTIRSSNVWINSNDISNDSFANTTFMNYNGSIRIISNVLYPNNTQVNINNLNISFNMTFLNSTNLSFLNTSGQITLRGLNFSNAKAIVDFNDTGNFTDCNTSICTEETYGLGTFIYNVTHFTYYSSDEELSLNIEMPKNSINCTVTLDQNVSSAILYTCGDIPSVGGTIYCDTNGSNQSSYTDPTNASTCDINAANFGSFLVTNNGTDAMLNATVVNITIDGVNTTAVYLDNYIFDAVSAPGCNNTNCNNCPAADTAGCYKDIDPGSPDPDSVLECGRFTSSGGVCECFSIHVDDEDTLHLFRNGSTLSFSLTKSVVSPAQDPCLGPT